MRSWELKQGRSGPRSGRAPCRYGVALLIRTPSLARSPLRDLRSSLDQPLQSPDLPLPVSPLVHQWITSRNDLEHKIVSKLYILCRLISLVMTKHGNPAECLLQTLKSEEAPPPPHQTSASSPDPNLEVRESKYVCFCEVRSRFILVAECDHQNQRSRSCSLNYRPESIQRVHTNF
jgi:hypothetical protein